MKKNILIVSALPVEQKILKKKISELNFKNLKCKFFLSGVGNYNVVYHLGNYLRDHQEIDFVLNIGVCGYVGEPLLADTTRNFHQVYRIRNASSLKESLPPIYTKLAPLISLLSSEKIITSPAEMLEETYCDMESYGIDYICTKYKIPFALLKVPFDKVSPDSKNVDITFLEQTLEAANYAEIFEKLSQYFSTLPEQKNRDTQKLENYKKYFGFTFAEFEIFKKQYNKCTAFGIDFENFFEENKETGKKEFLKKISGL